MHYDAVSNRVLWFLFHDLFDRIRRPRFDQRFRESWEAYRTVNFAFADATAEAAGPGDVVLVNDYQLSLVGARLRELRPDLRIVHFTHTPFCGPDDMRVLPSYAAEDLCGALARNPAGFHTARWARAYHQSARDVLGRRATIAPTFAASLGIDVDALDAVAVGAEAHAAANALDEAVGDRLVIARSDRIEPSKNIVRGFLAYDRLLEARPGLRGRVVFVAMLYPSRQTLPEYLAYASEIEQVVARVNERWATRDWTPVAPRRTRRLPALDCRDAALRRAAREPDQGRAQPRGQGRPGGQPPRRSALPVTRSRRRSKSSTRPRSRSTRTTSKTRLAALDRALATPLDERATIATKLRTLATARTPSDWVADLVAQRGLTTYPSAFVETPRDGVEQLDDTRWAVDETIDRGRQRLGHLRRPHTDREPHATADRPPAARASASNAGRSPVSSPTNAATANPSVSSSTAVPLSIADRRT